MPQKIVNADYFNFSVFGLAITLAIGGLIIVLSYIIEPLVNWIQKSRNLNAYARLEWSTNDTLQLQRLAHEELEMGTWDCYTAAVPVTKRGEMLAVLDLGDLDHPRLKAPMAKCEGLDEENLTSDNRSTARLVA